MRASSYLIDSHCHLHDPEFFSGLEQAEALKSASKNRVQKIICIGTSHADSLVAHDFAIQHQDYPIFWSYGIHPSEHAKPRQKILFLDPKNDRTTSDSSIIPAVVQETKIDDRPVAIGEVGLDYHYGNQDKKQQILLFEEMINLAVDNDLPLIFHVREAFEDFFAILNNFSSHQLRGVVHSFTDNKKHLKKSLEQGFYIGVNGLATYSTLPLPPLDRILLETDAPFLSPIPFRHQKNQPSHVKEIASWLARELQLQEEEVARITSKSAEELFKI